jgi:hypothetical protein
MKLLDKFFDTCWHYCFHLRHWFETKFTKRYSR